MAKRGNRRAAGQDLTRRCPCGSKETYDACCGRLHRGETTAATAEQLMRSRFSAFAVDDVGYLLRTWHSSRRPTDLNVNPPQMWTRLDILDTTRGGVFDTTGTVEFRAHYHDQGRPGTLQERSAFVREDGNWVYLDAVPEGR